MEFEKLLEDCGGFGRFQKEFVLLFMIPVAIVIPWFYTSLIFSVAVPDHRCYVPELELLNVSVAERESLRTPDNSTCSVRSVNYTRFFIDGDASALNDSSVVSCITGWRYVKDNYEFTAATEWNMVCNRSFYPSLILTLQNVGSLLGTPVYGFLSDKFGRRIVFFGLAIVVVVIETFTALLRNLTAFIILRTVGGSILPVMFNIPFILMSAWVAPRSGYFPSLQIAASWIPLFVSSSQLWIPLVTAYAYYQWDMVCNKSYYLSVVLTLQKAGIFIGTPIFGLFSDKLGRKTVLFVSGIVVTVAETISVFLSNVFAFMVFRVMASSVLSTCMTLMSIFCIELVPPENRAQMTGVINISWTVGLSIQPLIAYLTRNWVALAIINALSGIFILCYWKFLPESPCWLISKGRYEDAATVLKRIGDKNGKNPDETVLFKKLQVLGDEIKKKKDEETYSKFNLLKYPRLRMNFILITISWSANFVGYGGLLYNVRNMYGNEFLNYFLLAIVELPGNVAFMILMDRCGRRWTSSLGFLVSGIICLAPVTGIPYTDIVAAMAGKFLFSGNFMVTDQQASEVYPTVTRTFGIGAGKTISTALTLFLPYLADLDAYGKELPFAFISIVCIFAAIAVSFLPETLNENLPQTTSEAEDFGKDQKYFSWRRKKRTPTDVPTTIA